jgi:hypothetical protein
MPPYDGHYTKIDILSAGIMCIQCCLSRGREDTGLSMLMCGPLCMLIMLLHQSWEWSLSPGSRVQRVLSLMYMDIFSSKLLGLYVVRDSAIECAPTMKIRCGVLIQIAGGNRAMVSCSSAVLYFWLSFFCRLSTCQVSTLSVSVKYVGSWCKLNA